MTPTPKLNLNRPDQGTAPWDELINNNFTTLDEAIVRDEDGVPFDTQAYFELESLSETSGDIAWDVSVAPLAKIVLGGNWELQNPTNLKPATYVLIVEQGSGGNHAMTYDTAYLWPGGDAPTLSTAEGAIDVLTFLSDGTVMLGGFMGDFS